MYIALIDCNNFFASCEQVFNPAYRKRPLVVLSNNDGCVIARSKEAKALEIPMGAPAFKYESVFLQHNVVVVSSNFALYGDMSRRVIETLKTFNLPIEVYSIDEAFLTLPASRPMGLCKEIRKKVKQWTGISVSIGVASTKTQAKVANHAAKNGEGVVLYSPSLLSNLPVEEVWGIGRRTGKKLMSYGIRYGMDLVDASDAWVKKHLSIRGLRTVWELRGTPCLIPMEVPPVRKSILTSRSFKSPLFLKEDLKEALASFVVISARKLRTQKLKAHSILIFAGRDSNFFHLPSPSSSTPELIKYAHQALNTIFQPEEGYKRLGVVLSELTSENETQLSLFAKESSSNTLMKTVDEINARYGNPALSFGSEGINKNWKRPQNNRSPYYTTSWDEILTVKL